MEYELITVKQLPVLEEQFKAIGADIEAKVTKCKNMVVTESNYKDIKKVRAELNKESKTYADNFRSVKERVLEPWNVIEIAYKDNVRDKYAEADRELKAKIYEVEGELKAAKEDEIRKYYEEYAKSVHVDFVDWERAGIRVGLSDSKKSLKDASKALLDKVASDLEAIEALPQGDDYKHEVGADYRLTLDLSRSLQKIADRHARLEEEKKRAALRQQRIEKERAHAEAVAAQMAEEMPEAIQEPLQAPVEEKEINYVVSFRVTCPEHLKGELVRAFKMLKDIGCTFERI